jgi:FkbM family methyltransferase
VTSPLYLKTRLAMLVTVQRMFNLMGLQIRRLQGGASIDNAEQEVLRLAGRDVSCIVEFGAADGRDTEVFAKKFPTAKVIGIEPVPKSFAKLAARAAVAQNIVAIEAAVSDKAGTTKLFISSEADASSISAPVVTGSAFDRHVETVGTTDVKVVTLDDVCKDNGIEQIDILKMDAQGSELAALKGASKLLGSGAIKRIFTEVQFVRLYEDACLFFELETFLCRQDFYLHGIYNLSHNEHGQLCWGDAIFIHESVRPIGATRRFQGKSS